MTALVDPVAAVAQPAAEREPDGEAALPRVRWRELVKWAVVGTVVLALLVAVDVARHGGRNPVSLIQPGTQGPATEVVARDFPEVTQPDGLGLDGQQYYAIARDPLHLDDTADSLDNPRYRLQRPLLPWAAWALQPAGGGTGLILALLAVGLAAILAGALATGALSATWGGPVWLAALFPLLPGAYWSLRVTVSDAMALALAMVALALAARSRHGWAIAAGVAAVLAKEPMILLLVGWALHRRTRRDALIVAIPAAVAVTWMGWLAIQLPPDVARADDLAPPLVGLVAAFRDVWSEGRELVGMACTLGALAAAGVALARRGLRHPLGWALAIQVGFLLVMGVNPTSVNFGASRMAMPAMALALVMLATPRAAELEHRPLDPDNPPYEPTLDSADDRSETAAAVVS